MHHLCNTGQATSDLRLHVRSDAYAVSPHPLRRLDACSTPVECLKVPLPCSSNNGSGHDRTHEFDEEEGGRCFGVPM
jgi:hypothetical protein